NGTALFEVCRKRNKEFFQRRPDGNGRWSFKLGDVRRVLYRLPELIESVAKDQPIFIVEGEKDVENLRKLNVAATTNAGGAGKWRSECSELLRGADVILLPDNDEAGRAHMQSVAAALDDVAARVRRLDLPGLPEKGDVSDWLNAGGTVEELWLLAEAAQIWKP